MLMLPVCSVGALARLLLLRDARLNTLSLRGYAIVDTNAPRRTRSSRATSALRYNTLFPPWNRRRHLTAPSFPLQIFAASASQQDCERLGAGLVDVEVEFGHRSVCTACVSIMMVMVVVTSLHLDTDGVGTRGC